MLGCDKIGSPNPYNVSKNLDFEILIPVRGIFSSEISNLATDLGSCMKKKPNLMIVFNH